MAEVEVCPDLRSRPTRSRTRPWFAWSYCPKSCSRRGISGGRVYGHHGLSDKGRVGSAIAW